MRITFQATLDDLVDLSERLYRRNGILRAYRWRSRIGTAILLGLLAMAFARGSIEQRFFPLFVGMAVGAAVSVATELKNFRKGLVSNFQSLRGDGEPYLVACEIVSEELRTEHDQMRTAWDWSQVTAIDDDPGAITFWMRRGQAFAALKRAFTSPDEAAKFLELARRYREAAAPHSPPDKMR